MFSVIFDMDGTLLDTQKVYLDGWEHSGLEQGIKGLGGHIQYACGMNKAGWSKYLIDRFPEIDIDKFNDGVVKYVVANLEVRFKTGALELLNFLREKGIKTGIASGSSIDVIESHLSQLSALEYFDAIAGGDMVKNSKPAPDIFIYAAEKLGARPEGCIVFEDSENGIKAACNAGMRCIGIPDIAEYSEEVNKMLFYKLENLAQAIDIFEKMM